MKKNTQVGRYKIVAPVHKGSYFADYRVVDENDTKHYMRLINPAKLHEIQYEPGSNTISELIVSEDINHPNIIHQSDTGEAIVDGQRYNFIVRDFFPGEMLSDKLSREHTCTVYEVRHLICGVLNALKQLHTQPEPLIYNHISPAGILLDISCQNVCAKLCDFGHAQRLNKENRKAFLMGLSPFYVAPELFKGLYSTRTDLYAVGALMYHLIFGIEPWGVDLSKVNCSDRVQTILNARKTPLPIPHIPIFELDENLLKIMSKALMQDVDERFQSAEEFLAAMNGLIDVDCKNYQMIGVVKEDESAKPNIQKANGNGFADVAGMELLKQRLQEEVIDLLRDPEKYRKLRVKTPNGILLYGPPGCGKTFIAEKFAEELGCNFIQADCSDIASPYIHGGQSKISELFKEAAENAPTVLFLDELEAMITDRNRHTNVSEQGEVNVFLTHLNNCSDKGIIVVGATNKPDILDPAALRSGRLDIKVYVPAPDKDEREKILRLVLKDRADDNVDYSLIADKTEGYVTEDICQMINKAALTTAKRDEEVIKMQTIIDTIEGNTNQWPSVSAEELSAHERIRDKFENKRTTRPSVGFVTTKK